MYQFVSTLPSISVHPLYLLRVYITLLSIFCFIHPNMSNKFENDIQSNTSIDTYRFIFIHFTHNVCYTKTFYLNTFCTIFSRHTTICRRQKCSSHCLFCTKDCKFRYAVTFPFKDFRSIPERSIFVSIKGLRF